MAVDRIKPLYNPVLRGVVTSDQLHKAADHPILQTNPTTLNEQRRVVYNRIRARAAGAQALTAARKMVTSIRTDEGDLFERNRRRDVGVAAVLSDGTLIQTHNNAKEHAERELAQAINTYIDNLARQKKPTPVILALAISSAGVEDNHVTHGHENQPHKIMSPGVPHMCEYCQRAMKALDEKIVTAYITSHGKPAVASDETLTNNFAVYIDTHGGTIFETDYFSSPLLRYTRTLRHAAPREELRIGTHA